MEENCLTPVGKECYNDGIIGRYEKLYGEFQNGDWAVLACILFISLSIGIICAWLDRNKTPEEYMMGSKKTSPVPISMSLGATFFSAITVLGTPVEYYQYGTMFFYFIVTYFLCTVISAHLFVPMYIDFGYTSTYEYMETRFHSSGNTLHILCTKCLYSSNHDHIGIRISMHNIHWNGYICTFTSVGDGDWSW